MFSSEKQTVDGDSAVRKFKKIQKKFKTRFGIFPMMVTDENDGRGLALLRTQKAKPESLSCKQD